MGAISGHNGAFYTSRHNCLLFDAAGENLTVTDPSDGELDFGASDDFSIEMWIKVASTGDGYLLKKATGSEGVDLLGYIIEVATDNLKFYIGDGTNETTITSSTSVNDDEWHHVVLVRDTTNDKLYLYLDGSSDATGVTDSTTSTLASSGDLVWGSTDTGNTRRIGQTVIYNTVVSSSQASSLNGGALVSALKKYRQGSWPLIEGSGTDVHDDSKNRNDGTITSATWDTTTYNSVTGETPSGSVDGSNKTFTLANENVDDSLSTLTITVDGSPLSKGDYTITPKGTITCDTAPVTSINVDYNYYPMTLEGGGFTSWSLDYTGEALECTEFSSGGDREYIPGVTSWSGSADRYWINGGLAYDLGTKLIFKFYHDEANSKYFDGYGFITGCGPTVAVDSVIEESIDIQGSGELGIETS